MDLLLISMVSLGRPYLRLRQSRVNATAAGVMHPAISCPSGYRSCNPSRTLRSRILSRVRLLSVCASYTTMSQMAANDRSVRRLRPGRGLHFPFSLTILPWPPSCLVPTTLPPVDVPSVITLLRRISAWDAMPAIARAAKTPAIQALAARHMAGHYDGVQDLGVWERKDGTHAARFVGFRKGDNAFVVAVWPEPELAISEHRVKPRPDLTDSLRAHWTLVSSGVTLAHPSTSR